MDVLHQVLVAYQKLKYVHLIKEMNHNVKHLKEMVYHVQERMLVKIEDVQMFLILQIQIHVLLIYLHADLMDQLVLIHK